MKMEIKEDNKRQRHSGTEGERNGEMKITVNRNSYVQSALRQGPRVLVRVLQFTSSFYLAHLTNVHLSDRLQARITTVYFIVYRVHK
jgi:hypothetical protein